jgi:predicted adenine nucleotide alpha hydrolase (AANH) superfamily ATPase
VKIVLHICCGVCAAAVAERLKKENHDIIGFFYNPNLYPPLEFEKRLGVARLVAENLDFPLEAPAYVPDEWYRVAGHLRDEPEDGSRCVVCYRLRLGRAYDFMKDRGADAFTTTLTVSPRKKAAAVNQVGIDLAGEHFLVRDFKKQDGFKRSGELAKEWGLYRQHYCGCEYSLRS